jgi:hypothetical protein
MDLPVDYTKKPYAFYVIETEETQLQSLRAVLAISHAQFSPWDNPQREEHKRLISEKRGVTGTNNLIHTAELFHDPELSIICSHNFYFNPAGRFMNHPERISLENYARFLGLDEALALDWNKPGKTLLNRLAHENHCVLMKDEVKLYGIWDNSGQDLTPIVVTHLRLVRQGDMRHAAGGKHQDNVVMDIERARDPDFGPIDIICLQTDSRRFFERFRSYDVDVPSIWNQSIGGNVSSPDSSVEDATDKIVETWGRSKREILLPNFLCLFSERPTAEQIYDQRRRFGLVSYN